MTTLAAVRKWNARAWTGRDAPGWLGLAASPTFALMAWIVATGASGVAVCASASSKPAIDGMAWMYLLMSLFHVSPWLKLASGRTRQLTHRAS